MATMPMNNGGYVKAGLAELELWCCEAKEEVILVPTVSCYILILTKHSWSPDAGSAWDELKPIRRVVGFLVIRQKYRISYYLISNDSERPATVQSLHSIPGWDNNYNTRSVSTEHEDVDDRELQQSCQLLISVGQQFKP
ncbi:Myosin-6 [Sesamum alatum]|uniref:Myosin-6 n=1 Tax=Sesamum alatum TaxID=300844 RepID=A0AAE1XR97_9LAMI|nr:Myosin-6 [Sesamum alatum]